MRQRGLPGYQNCYADRFADRYADRLPAIPVTTFSTVSRARLRHANAGPQPAGIAQGCELAGRGERELRRAAPPGRWHQRERRGALRALGVG